jgi:catechol 2,3-dioxygenase-like lactoylglutathione lyase family enzyme
MTKLNFALFYVAEPSRSADFYTTLLGVEPVERSANFAMFVLKNGFKLGLWRRTDVQPPAEGGPGASELILAAESDRQVDDLFAEWTGNGVVIAQNPTQMDFGYTFVGLDPDGHRLRVYKMAEQPR